jgi:hypothetical protein
VRTCASVKRMVTEQISEKSQPRKSSFNTYLSSPCVGAEILEREDVYGFPSLLSYTLIASDSSMNYNNYIFHVGIYMIQSGSRFILYIWMRICCQTFQIYTSVC